MGATKCIETGQPCSGNKECASFIQPRDIFDRVIPGSVYGYTCRNIDYDPFDVPRCPDHSTSEVESCEK